MADNEFKSIGPVSVDSSDLEIMFVYLAMLAALLKFIWANNDAPLPSNTLDVQSAEWYKNIWAIVQDIRVRREAAELWEKKRGSKGRRPRAR